jgi:hypothetical protein
MTGAALRHGTYELDNSKRKGLRAILEFLWRHQTSFHQQSTISNHQSSIANG